MEYEGQLRLWEPATKGLTITARYVVGEGWTARCSAVSEGREAQPWQSEDYDRLLTAELLDVLGAWLGDALG